MAVAGADQGAGDVEEVAEDAPMIDLNNDIDDDIEPQGKSLSLIEARQYVEALHSFVSENNDIMDKVSMSSKHPSLAAIDSLRDTLQRMQVTHNTRQSSVRSFFEPAPRPIHTIPNHGRHQESS